MNVNEACKIALNNMPGCHIISASETDDGWLFSFENSDGTLQDELPMLISKEDGRIIEYSYEDYFVEILEAEPVELSELKL